ncbi:MAG: hypothetical protein ACLQNE_10970 [Thermoguttaceae bacterium]
MRRQWLLETGIFLGLWLVMAGFAPSRFFRDPGTFWHVRLGQQTLETGQLPRADTFSFTMRGKPWVSQYWLCDIGMAGLYNWGGWDALLLATTAILATVYAWIGGRLHRAGLASICSILVAVWAFAASSRGFHARPVVLTLAFLGATFALLVDVESGRRPLRALWRLVPLFVLWTNLHGGVLGGLCTTFLATAGWAAQGLVRRGGPVRSFRSAMELAAILLACGLAILVNPYGWEVPKLWMAILHLPLADLIQEHGPLWGLRSAAVLVTGLALLYLVALLSTLPQTPRVTWLIPFVWFVLACEHRRHASLFAVTAAIALADLLPHSGLGRILAWRGLFDRGGNSGMPSETQLGWRRGLAPGILVAVGLLVQGAGLHAPLLGRGWAQLDPSHWPVAMIPVLAELNKNGSAEKPVFNEMVFGGFLIFYAPRMPVFIDDRCELYGLPFIEGTLNVVRRDPANLERLVQQYGIEYAFTERDSAVDKYLADSPRWRALSRAGRTTLWERAQQGAAESSFHGSP